MIKLWNYLDGKKTAIGAGLLLLCKFLTAVVVGVWHYDPSFMDPTIQTLNYIGIGFSSMGLGHKAVKSATNNQP